jgi:hypothetical protein
MEEKKMVGMKRVLVATLCGLFFGLVCMGLASSNPDPAETLTVTVKLNIVLSRTLMGFMIGISALKISWWLHGIVMGFISSIPMAIAVMDKMEIMVGTVVMGMIYGLLTELITTKLFKSKSPALA